MIRVVLPAHLRTLASVEGEVKLDVQGQVTQRSVLDALEAQYPMLCGTLRDHVTQQRRPFVRFFACEEDLSHEPPDAPLPDAVVKGDEPFLVVGAIAGGAAPVSKSRLWAGRIMSGLAVAFLLLDGVMKVLKAAPAEEGTIQLGYPSSILVGLGVLLLVCTFFYVIPQTSVLGAILLTGYLGGAVATQLRVGNPLFSHVLFPVYVGVMIWGGLLLRENRLRSLIPLRS